MPFQRSAGEVFAPSQVNLGSIVPPSLTSPPANARLDVNGAVVACSEPSPPHAATISATGIRPASKVRRIPSAYARRVASLV